MAMVQQADMAVKANEILARFRPIAPKPALAAPSPAQAAADGVVAANRVLCQLQSRPCRARKRGRPSVVPAAVPPAAAAAQPALPRRKRAASAAPYPPLRCATATDAVATATRAHVSVAVPGSASACLPLVSLPPGTASAGEPAAKVASEEAERDVPVERDLLRKLLEPTVISPRAVRPVCSAIHVESSLRCAAAAAAAVSKTAAEVEAELEADALPAVVSDSSNRVRLVNDAYKEMVGQPECPWLDAVAAASRRISGEVVLVVAEQAALPESHGVFTCTAKIEWEYGGRCTAIRAPCDVSRLQCESRDYLFIWRLRTADASEGRCTRESETSES
ncbi:hypothetical protein ACP4OV_018771 [Aristida adscensionis]